MRWRFAAPAGLVSALLVFGSVFVITRSLLWAPILAGAAAIGFYLMLDDRNQARVSSDDYAAEARQKVDEALELIRGIERLATEVRTPSARKALESACHYVPELFTRVQAKSPNSLYSTASQICGHLRSLDGAVHQYLDIQRQPVLYRDPDALCGSGEQAFQRFADFTLESVRLVNQGDLAQYKANLDTVAPPKLPELG
ncbi:5-bromo-4-chloroindolyl phosphate hydrolysis family protein [Solwaraspora sp. WMMB335]|uniref:5-bromo-4-chloroindolyl phosphate hydrolysis family protein n=1 Tax=Solwaraspora sp. WMMB335 TaxID=3404118 RepID=UPI003B925D99